ncbi:hypothetical protein L202_06151 [Cryptococcus amylolentus CBS 6039]|uniref:Uncharacterized protein n=1 Tax=Cryptococcus amylolentus CBS 6039 TaxID=1295533 RepID=A0A1E3HIQ7_9TREE|nr:hypothetical protein L202_06151 [Cryptococcus amylolentus CBS 6039]ODN76229.1 hypothetical protein L202_06151 [Cryptococcus amylolentus CBS 6039]
MIYDLPRRTDTGEGEWKRQIMLTEAEMSTCMSEIEYQMRRGEVEIEKWLSSFQRWKMRFTNLAPLPADVDIPQLFLDKYLDKCPDNSKATISSSKFHKVFRKWCREAIGFEGPTKCECCEIFGKGHPKSDVYRTPLNPK